MAGDSFNVQVRAEMRADRVDLAPCVSTTADGQIAEHVLSTNVRHQSPTARVIGRRRRGVDVEMNTRASPTRWRNGRKANRPRMVVDV